MILLGGAGVNDFALLIQTAEQKGAHAVLGDPVADELVSRFGILETDEQDMLRGIMEKPQPDQTASRLRNISKYVFMRSFTPYVEHYMNSVRDGEYMLTDVISMAVEGGERFTVCAARGRYLDGGSSDGWLEANNVIMSEA